MEKENIFVNDEHETPFNSYSFDLLLSTAKSEYENEHNRTTILDTKTNISLPIISALFLAIAQINNYRGIRDFDKIVLATKLIELYIKAQDHNNATNNSRIIFYQRGWVFASISIISYVFYVIFNNITGG